MKAAFVTQLPATQLAVRGTPDLVPGPGQVLVDVEACGICGTDLHILGGESYRPALPFVLGHEPAGIVVAAGSAEDSALVGRRVVPTLFRGCGSCSPCRTGLERLCTDMRSITGVLGSWGGFAEQVLLWRSQVVEVPAGLSPAVAASLVDGGATAMNAARVVLQLQAAETVIVGGGPIGYLIAEILSQAGRMCVVVETQAVRGAALARRGHAVRSSLSEVGTEPDVVIDCSAAEGVVPWALERLRPRGWLIAVGYRVVPGFDMALIARRELTVRGIRSGARDDLEHVLALVSGGRVHAPSVTTWPLERINDALAALREGTVEGKAVMTPR